MSTVELRAARIPYIGLLAHHHWFVVCDDDGNLERWEVWQDAGCCPTSRGHLHKNLLPCSAGVGSGPSWSLRLWSDAQANELIRAIHSSMDAYPWCHEYHYWPGPNSNTYVQWILGQRFDMPWRAVGRRFARRTN